MFVETLLTTLKLALIIQLAFFLLAFIKKTDLFTDLSYGLTFIVLTLFLIFQQKQTQLPQMLLSLAILLWALRLINYLLIRIIVIKKDRRFDGVRENFFRFFLFWFFQGLSVWLIMLPAIFYLTLKVKIGFNLLIPIGLLIWFKGLVIETVADWQKFSFKLKPENKKKWIESGLWRYSRHPNYFGEIMCWWGLFIMVAPHLQGWQYLTIIGPLYITFLLLFVSGIPTLEKRYKQIYGKNKQYLKYKKQTSLLIPLPKFK